MASHSHVWQALALTFLGAAGTAVGGLMVVAQPRMDFKRLGLLQGLAAGLMLCISLLDLLPEAAEEVGVVRANTFFYLGAVFFAVVVYVIPEPELLLSASPEPPRINISATAVANGALPPAPPAAAASGYPVATTAARAGITSATLSTRHSAQLSDPDSSLGTPLLQPTGALKPAAAAKEDSLHSDEKSAAYCAKTLDRRDMRQRRQVLMSGLITAVGIALHNFPEGVAVFLAAHKCHALGVSLALAIALHNIPEGVAVALPVYFATGDRWQGLMAACLSGLAEPLAVVVVGLLLPVDVPKDWVNCMLAAVGGIMAFLSFHELLPLSIQHAGKTAAVVSLFVGMALMSVNLHLLDMYVTSSGMPH